jgi:outer membrane protein insertion porin family
LVIGVCLLLTPFAIAQEGEIVKDVEIQGLHKTRREKVLYALPVKVGEPYRMREPGELIHAVYDLGLFTDDIQVLTERVEGGIKLILVVHENPTIKEIQFVGNTRIPARQLELSMPVKTGDLIAPDTAVKIRSAIEKLYRAKGFSGASVTVNAVDRGTTQSTIQVLVNEGRKVKIKDLIIRGNENVRTALLKLQLENKGSWLFIENYFDADSFQTDLDMVRLYYISKGYLDVEVKAGEFVTDPQGNWVSPVIEIVEGPRYRVGEVRPSGFTLFMREEVLQPFQSIQGKYYDAEAFKEAVDRLKSMYGDQGYINAEIVFDYDTKPGAGLVNFDVRINEHDRIYVREVKVKRNELPIEDPTLIDRVHEKISPPASDDVVKREVQLKPGEAYKRFEEVATVDRLKSLGIFDQVKTEAALTDDPSQRDMILSLEEGNTGNIVFGVGLSEWAGAYLHGAYINRNLFGEARHLRTSFLLGTRDMQFRIGYLDRYFDPPGTALDKFFRTDPTGLVPFQAELYRDTMRLREYEETHTGVSAVITRILNHGTVTEDWGGRLEFVQTDKNGFHSRRWGWFGSGNDNSNNDDNDEDFAEHFGSYPVFALTYNVEENTTDDWWWPTRGHILGGGAEVGFADGPLLKLNGRYSLYKKLNEDLIYALNARAGLMPFGADNVGISERLFMGGSGDMRGFAFRGVGPTDRKNDNLHIGGSTKLLVQNELRFPIYQQLKGFGFVDAGMLGKDPFQFDTPRVSTGVGVRFSTAKAHRYAPRWRASGTEFDIARGFHVEVSLGIPVVKENTDDRQYLHFVIGSAF